MVEEMDKLVAQLADRDTGWVYRRDAAEALGRAAQTAVEALHAHADEEDRDVRDVVDKALGWAKGALEGVAPVAQERAFTLEELARSLEKPGNREVTSKGDGYEITVKVGDGRSQHVLAEPATSKAGRDIIRISTRCGKANDNALRWALRNNTELSHCALALSDEDGQEIFVMVNSFLADAVTPTEMKVSVKEVAYYGDWIESKLSDEDEF